MPDSTDSLIGTTFENRYEILDRLGQGGMSVVYKARHLLMDRLVAIKMLHNHMLDNPSSIDRFKLEAQAVSRLNHPNVMTAFDFGILPSGLPYMVMNFVPGESLEDVVDREKRISAQRCVAIMVQVCDALMHAHSMGVLHRDLKPSNIMLSNNEQQVRVIDFGLATFLPSAGLQQLKLTQPTQIIGSPLYMSPEQCRGETADERTDIYSLGCLMYECLAGIPPFVGSDWLEVVKKQVFSQVEPIQDLEQTPVADRLHKIIMRALEKEPDARQTSMAELKAQLEALTSTSTRDSSIEISLPRELAFKPFTILAVDDMDNLRQHAVQLLKTRIPGPPQVLEASNGEQALQLFFERRPDMVIMDISMPGINGIKAAQQIWNAEPRTKILFWSQYHREIYVREIGRIIPDDAIHGYALKTESDEKFAYAVASILLYDNPYIDPIVRNVQKRLRERHTMVDEEQFEALTDMAVGLTDRAIAMRRHVSIKGVQTRAQLLRQSLLDGDVSTAKPERESLFDLRSRTIYRAIKLGLLQPDDFEELENQLTEWLEDEFDFRSNR